MPELPITIRPPRDAEEGLRFFQLAATSLAAPQSLAQVWMEREGLDNVRLALAGDRIAGGLAVQRAGQWFGGRSVGCGIVRAVAVAPAFRGARVAESLMRSSLEEMRQADLPLSFLFPATHVLYRRAGYEQAGAYLENVGPVAELPVSGEGDDLEMSEIPLDDPALPALYEAWASRHNGLFARSSWLWRRLLEPAKPLDLSLHLIGPRHAPEGYVLTHVEPAADMLRSTLWVRDRAFVTPRALRRATSFFVAHRSVIENVRITGGFTDPLLLALPNPRQRIARRDVWMLRIVDVTRALEARGYPAGVDAEVHLAIRDPFLSPAEQRLILRVREGAATVAAGGRGEVTLDVRGLAALYSGFLSPEELWSAGLLVGEPARAVPLSPIFSGPAPWGNDFV